MIVYTKKNKRESALSITSLIDVIFMLVIFFMLASTFDKAAVPVSLPSSSSVTAPVPRVLGITIDADGIMYFNNEKVSSDELKIKVRDFAAVSPEKNAILYCDGTVPLSTAVSVIDILTQGGIENVAVKTTPASVSKN